MFWRMKSTEWYCKYKEPWYSSQMHVNDDCTISYLKKLINKDRSHSILLDMCHTMIWIPYPSDKLTLKSANVDSYSIKLSIVPNSRIFVSIDSSSTYAAFQTQSSMTIPPHKLYFKLFANIVITITFLDF